MRELAELATVFVAAGLVHFVSSALGHYAYGPLVLIVLGVGVIAVALGHRWRVTRRRTARADQSGTTSLWRVRAALDDVPGRLAALAGSLGELRVNIRTVQVHPTYAGTVDELLVNVPTQVAEGDLHRAVVRAGGRDVQLEPADPHDLTDVPTWTLSLANQLVADHDDLAAVLGRLVRAEVTRRGEPMPDRPTDAVGADTIWLSDPGGGVLVLSRRGAPFTPTEFARARAMTDLAATLLARRDAT